MEAIVNASLMITTEEDITNTSSANPVKTEVPNVGQTTSASAEEQVSGVAAHHSSQDEGHRADPSSSTQLLISVEDNGSVVLSKVSGRGLCSRNGCNNWTNQAKSGLCSEHTKSQHLPAVVAKPGSTSSAEAALTPPTRKQLRPNADNMVVVTEDELKEMLERKRKENVIDKSCLGRGIALEKQLQETIINLKDYFEQKNPLWSDWKVVKEIERATKINAKTLMQTIAHFRTHRTFKTPKVAKRRPKFLCSDDDRQILERCVYRLKEENRLTGVNSVYNEMHGSKDLNPSFKNCGRNTFAKIFKASGFRISDTRIVIRRPTDPSSGQMSGTFSKSGPEYVCDWPGCEKRCRLRQHMVCHLRTHTNEKPFVCAVAGCQYRCATSGNFNKHLKVHDLAIRRETTVDTI